VNFRRNVELQTRATVSLVSELQKVGKQVARLGMASTGLSRLIFQCVPPAPFVRAGREKVAF
jgi:hypothetical protein